MPLEVYPQKDYFNFCNDFYEYLNYLTILLMFPLFVSVGFSKKNDHQVSHFSMRSGKEREIARESLET